MLFVAVKKSRKRPGFVIDSYFKGAVSRNSAKLANYKMPVEVKRNIKITN